MASTDELFAALCRLRAAARSGARDHRAERDDWRVVDVWLRRHRAVQGVSRDDLVQESLIAIARRVHDLDSRDPPSAAAWVSRIAHHKRIDAARARAREVRRAEVPSDETVVEAVPRDDAWQLDETALAKLLAIVEDAITGHVATLALPPADALLRRTQARATLHRVLGASQAELRAALVIDDAVSNDRVHKWVERGRPILVAAIDRVETEAEDVLRTLLDALREAALERRADAGLARPSRRKSVEADKEEKD